MRVLNDTGGWPMLQGPWDGTHFDLTHFLSYCYDIGIPFEQFFKISFSAELNLLQVK